MELQLDGRTLVLERHQAVIEKSLELAGCYVVTTDVLKQNMNAQEVHDSYVSLQKVETICRERLTGVFLQALLQLFVAQRHDRIDSRRSLRRNHASCKRHDNQRGCRSRIHKRSRWRHTEQ